MPTNTFKLERPGGIRDSMTANPANVEHILKTNFENYPKGEHFTTAIHDFLGRGIFNVDGELCKMQRKTASYEFKTKSLRSFVVSFMFAGRDSTSVALTWFFWLLSSHPTVEEAIYTEILHILAKRSQPPAVDEEVIAFSFEELKDMQYLHAALCESMRLYPPVPIDTKLASKDDVLPDGICVGKGCHLSYINYSMGRMENIWGSDCLQFKPERWLEEGEFVQENPYKFPVFQAGPRICLGKEMAFIQMKSVVASIIHGFSFKVEDGITCPDYVVSLTMRMKGGLPVTVRCR